MEIQKSEDLREEKIGIDAEMAIETDINILRNKTFNRELKSLVNRIVSNEEKPEEEDLEDLTDDRLLYKLHKIFYRIKSLDEIESVYSSFNPFLFNGENELYREIADYLKTAFNSMNIVVYDILTFNFTDRCFSSIFTELKPEVKTDIIINLRDNLFRQMWEEQSGYILTADEIKRDSFLSKKFIDFEDEKSGDALLFLRLSSIIGNLIKELDRDHKAGPLVECLSPIVIFKLVEQSRDDTRKRIDMLRNELSIPLYLYLGRFIPSIDLLRYDDLDSLVSIVETLLNVSVISEELNGILIKVSRICSKQMLYEIKYLISRLKNNLDDYTSFIRIKSDTLFILTHKKNTGIVQGVAAEYNRVYENIFDIEIINREKRDEIPSIILKICL